MYVHVGQNLMVPFALLLPIDVPDRVELAISFYCHEKGLNISKQELLNFLKVCNDTLGYFGDKSLHITQIDDLVDSVYTLKGKIDGEIGILDVITLMFQHPIVEMVLSVQFQGLVVLKTADVIFDGSRANIL